MNRKAKAALGLFGLAGVCAAARFLYWNNKAIVTTEYEYGSDRIPEDFHGFRIVMVSDLQSEYFGPEQKNLLAHVTAAEPDIIVITGDLLDRTHTDYMASITAARKLLDVAPVYYISGNHENDLPQERVKGFYEILKQLGVRLLDDQVEVLRRGDSQINLIGISEDSIFAAKALGHDFGYSFQPQVLLRRIREVCEEMEEGFSIMLVHEPQYLEEYAKSGVDLVLAGHAHGGQFRFPGGQGWFAPGQGPLPKYVSGFYHAGDTTMVLSRGLGNSVFPFRLNNRPEVVTVVLK